MKKTFISCDRCKQEIVEHWNPTYYRFELFRLQEMDHGGSLDKSPANDSFPRDLCLPCVTQILSYMNQSRP